MNIAVIGSGIAAHALIFHLEKSFPQLKITCYSASHLIPPCSISTMAVVTLRETTYGLSPLGDLIYDSYFAFEKFFIENKPLGVEQTTEEQWWDPMNVRKNDKFERRFKNIGRFQESKFLKLKSKLVGATYPCYVINPGEFLKGLQEKSKTKFIQALVTDVKNKELTFLSGEKKKFDLVFDCTGFMSNFNHGEKFQAFKQKKTDLGGAFCSINFESGPTSWSVGFNDYHLIYRASDKKLLVGAYNEQNSVLAPKFELEDVIKDLENNFHLKIHNPEFHLGVRVKTPRRMPFYEEVAPETYAINGLYKYGFTFAFTCAEKLNVTLSKVI